MVALAQESAPMETGTAPEEQALSAAEVLKEQEEARLRQEAARNKALEDNKAVAVTPASLDQISFSRSPQTELRSTNTSEVQTANGLSPQMLKDIQNLPGGEDIIQGLGGPDKINLDTYKEIMSLRKQPELLEKIADFASKELNAQATAAGYNKQGLVSSLINHVAKSSTDFNIGSDDLCPAGAVLAALIQKDPKQYASLVTTLFTGEANALGFSLHSKALESEDTALSLGRKAKDQLEKAMLATVTDAAVKLAWETRLESDPQLREEVDGHKPFYDPKQDKVFYPYKDKETGKVIYSQDQAYKGLNRMEGQAAAIIVHGGAARLDLHQLTSNPNSPLYKFLETEQQVTPESLRKFAEELEHEAAKDLKQFADLLEESAKTGEAFPLAAFYQYDNNPSPTLHFLRAQYVVPEEGPAYIEYRDTAGELEAGVNLNPFKGCQRDTEQGNRWTTSLRDLLLHGNVDHALDVVTEAGKATTNIEKDPFMNSLVWSTPEEGVVIIHGERIALHHLQNTKTGKVGSQSAAAPSNPTQSKPIAATTEELKDNVEQNNGPTAEMRAQMASEKALREAAVAGRYPQGGFGIAGSVAV
ncbi:MAG: hypothetical protein R3A13_06615 [Bdellovibrionota bacterium]